jgi:hypothetical protein
MTTATGGIGYGTGSGGTVTQATDKTTAVTLSKPTGKITMAATALAAGASVTFQHSNTLVTFNDTVVANVAFNSLNYRLDVIVPAAGAIFYRLTNVSGGSLSEAVGINFAIIKGAIA